MLEKPVVLITGGNRGLGRAMALAFAKKGYGIGLNYFHSDDEAKKTADEIEKLAAPCKVLKANVTDSKDVNAMMRMISLEWGRLDVLINNAGKAKDQRLEKMTDEEWNQVLAMNLSSAFYVSRAAFPLMQSAKKGSILNVSSYLAKKPAVGAVNYAAAKAGLLSFTQSAALEWGRFNIRVNAVMPGFHVTDMNEKVWKKYETLIRKQHLLEALPEKDAMAEFVYSIAHLKTVTGQVFPYESRL